MTKFYWLRDERNNPVAVIASDEEDGVGGKIVRFSLAIFNPKDDFDKARGRAVAEGRLNKKKAYMALASNAEVKYRLLGHIAGDVELPTRVRRAAAGWLEKHPQKAA